MKKLSDTLTTIQKVLEDAEDKQFQSKAIQNWLSKLSDIAFEIEDILDECVTEVSKNKKRKGVSRFVRRTLYNYKIGRRMKEVAGKLDAIKDHRNFHLCESEVAAKSSEVDWIRERGCIVNEPNHIYGRDEDRDKIVDMLLNQVPNCDHQLSVLPIIGIGGLGKTTLAQLVYNDERVTQHFDIKLWVCVSDNFDLTVLVKAMIESATRRATDLMEFAALQLRLQEVLNGKKYLLILDDVWNDDQEAWAQLKGMLLACGSKGSSIVVTTRLQKVGDVMGTFRESYCLKELLEEHCWLLFKLRAFGLENEQHHHPKLEAIGRQIVKKCAGVPLAAKALGGLLRFKKEEKEWIRVKESEIWNLPEEENSILPVLRLSYRHLPVVLKRCFVYCAVFPKDLVIEKQDLIFRWMAHGCISSKGKQEVEDVGDQVWKELAYRSFFQEVKTSEGETTFKMHDLVHDLAQSIMENKIPGAEMKGSSNTSVSNSKIREVHYKKYSCSSSSITLQVSTLTPIMNYNRLRLLKLRFWEEEELPSAIGKLKHLRCLDLSYSSSIRTLPQTFCGLWNLQTLILTNCGSLKSLPKNIRCMTNLRHIVLEGRNSLRDMPSRIRELASLKTLSLFIVGDKIGNQLDELEHLNLEGRLRIRHLERVPNHLNAKKANLVGKPNLRYLLLSWEYKYERASFESANVMDDEKVLEALEPHVNLKILVIAEFQGGHFPLWMTKMENLTRLTIQECPNCTHLPPLGGLPHLRSLSLSYLPLLEYMNGEDDIEVQNLVFPSLEDLNLYCLPSLKGLFKKEPEDQIIFPNLRSLILRHVALLEYINGEDDIQNSVFPSLKVLDLEDLPNLKGLLKKEPEDQIMFPNLQTLNISKCELLMLPPLGGLPHLQSLIIRDVALLEYMNGEDDIEVQNSVFPSLEVLDLYSLPNLKGLLKKEPEDQIMFPNLQTLNISNCELLMLPPLGGLPHLPHLRSLELSNLPLLEYMNGEDDIEVQNLVFPSLEDLTLYCLPSLKGLFKKEPEDQIMFPNLERLRISNCELLMLPPLSLSVLKKLTVEKCSLLTLSSFSNCKIENLSNFFLGFDNNNTRRRWNIPEDALDGFSNLRQLGIECAGQQLHLPQKWFEGLKSLTTLILSGCMIGSSCPEGWLRHLTALEELEIYKCRELVEMGEEIRYLHLLKKLTLFDVDEMVSLPQGLQHIPTLQSLTLQCLRDLTSLPDWLGNLTSLTQLQIDNCPRVTSLPSSIKGITSLKSLSIYECPEELKRRCEKEKGEDWHIIAHIPHIYIARF